MTHPRNLAAVVAWWTLLEAELWIAPTMEAEAESGRPSRPVRPRDASALRRAGALWRAARSETVEARTAALRAGLTDTAKGIGTIPDIAERIATLVDARTVASRAKFDLLTLIGQAACDRLDNAINPAGAVDLRDLPIPDALRDLDPWRAAEADELLQRATRHVLAAVRVSPATEPYEAECPSCGTYGLVWEVAARDPAEWTVLCSYDCACLGEPCRCGLTVRVSGIAHRWEPSLYSPALISALSFDQAIDEIRRVA